MTMNEIRLHAGADRTRVELFARLVNDSIVVILQGGEVPHVGAVVLTIPRPSLEDENQISHNSWIMPVLGHKDDEIARVCAEKITRSTGKTTVVIAGIHIHDARSEEIYHVIELCDQLVQQLLDKIKFK